MIAQDWVGSVLTATPHGAGCWFAGRISNQADDLLWTRDFFMICDKCGTENSGDHRYCSNCDAELWVLDPVAPDTWSCAGEPEWENQELWYRAGIGEKNTEYYLERFARFDANGMRPSWNWPAFFLQFWWLAYRKMWLLAAAFLLVIISQNILLRQFEAGELGFAAQLLTWSAWPCLVAFYFVFPMFANAIYHRATKKKIRAYKDLSVSNDEKLQWLASKGGVSRGVYRLGMAVIFVAIAGILAAVAIPAYQDFTLRTQVATSISESDAYRDRMLSFIIENQRAPGNIDEMGGFQRVSGSSIQSISIAENAVLVVTLESNASVLNGRSILWLPDVNERGEVFWHCAAPEIADKLLPAACRSESPKGVVEQ